MRPADSSDALQMAQDVDQIADGVARLGASPRGIPARQDAFSPTRILWLKSWAAGTPIWHVSCKPIGVRAFMTAKTGEVLMAIVRSFRSGDKT